MLNDVITTTDPEAATTDYTLVNRDGYNSLRRNLAAESARQDKLEIKNTIDLNAVTKPNRHLILLSKNLEDAVSGEIQTATVHVVITRHKELSDGMVVEMCYELGSILENTTIMGQILQGAS